MVTPLSPLTCDAVCSARSRTAMPVNRYAAARLYEPSQCHIAYWPRRTSGARRDGGPLLLFHSLRQLIAVGEIGELRDVGLELQRHGSGRSVALLADDHLGFAVHPIHFGLPI